MIILRTQILYETTSVGISKWTAYDSNLTTDLKLCNLSKALKYIPAISYWEMFLKIAHRGYISPQRNYLMGNIPEAKCTRCGAQTADLFHCLWACSLIQPFWQRMLSLANTHTTFNLDLTPAWALFGHISSECIGIPQNQKRLHFCISAAAHKTILQTWLDPERPKLRVNYTHKECQGRAARGADSGEGSEDIDVY